MTQYTKAGAPTQGVNEVTTLTPGGTISGGTFRITFEGQQTADIQWNATAAAVQAALEALSNVGVGDVVAAGGPVQTAPITLTWHNDLGGSDRTQPTIQSSLTGSAPTLTPSTSTAGVAGSFRGAKVGDTLVDTTNSLVYTLTSADPTTWTQGSGFDTPVANRITEATPTAYVDSTHMPKGANDYTFGPIKLG